MVTHRSILLLSLVLGPACLTIDEDDLVKRQEEVQDGDDDGYVDVELGGDDCDDGDPAVNPGAQEVWYDGVDSDCDGADDSDADGDGFASDEYGGDDCNDEDETIRPDAEEDCEETDRNCDGSPDEDATDMDEFFVDGDGDGYGAGEDTLFDCQVPDGYSAMPGDCDDGDTAVNPGADEYCDGVDNDCDDQTDEADAEDALTWYPDDDKDTWGDDSEPSEVSCEPPEDGWIFEPGDCDDEDGDVHPDADEECDGVDNDCDGDTDESEDAIDATNWYVDMDGDWFGSDDEVERSCEQPSGFIDNDTDCDDSDPDTYPGAAEIEDTEACMTDTDEDGYGDSAASGDIEPGTDCDDSRDSVNPGATETWYDGVDSDCADDNDYDADADGYDSEDHSGEDCDDARDSVNPGATEICDNTVDDDCDGAATGCTLEGDYDEGDADAKFKGNEAGDYAGMRVAGLGDFDGDGLDDMLVTAPYAYGDASSGGSQGGEAYVILGATSFSSDDLDDVSEIVIEGGSNTWDFLGAAGGPAGDVNGDGLADLVLGAWYADTGSYNHYGEVYLYHGDSRGGTWDSEDDADVIISGSSAEDWLGYTVTGAGDTDDDGYDDLVISAKKHDHTHTNAGTVFFFQGPLTNSSYSASSDNEAMFYGEETYAAHGGALAAAGDVNGDGLDDVVVGAPMFNVGGTESGGAYVLYGPISGDIAASDADVSFRGEEAGDYAGWSVEGGQDVDGDGTDDVLIGAPFFDTDGGADAGMAYLFHGDTSSSGLSGTYDLSSADVELSGGDSSGAVADMAGMSVAFAGDVDADGVSDVLVGAPGENARGAVYLLYGPVTVDVDLLDDADVTISSGESASSFGGYEYDHFGPQVSGVGDPNGDGLDDFLIGAPELNANGTDAGAAFLFLGHGM